ncbi:hypothetical protein BD560DRAFT_444744 [Blakeslea trispora]|nr:hypothetical protein BD560DRAFT_444744 [Blakeslea trispora]
MKDRKSNNDDKNNSDAEEEGESEEADEETESGSESEGNEAAVNQPQKRKPKPHFKKTELKTEYNSASTSCLSDSANEGFLSGGHVNKDSSETVLNTRCQHSIKAALVAEAEELSLADEVRKQQLFSHDRIEVLEAC